MTQPLVDKSEHRVAFPKLSHDQLAEIKPLATLKSLPTGEVLFQAGEKSIPFYVVEVGCLEVFDDSSGDRRTITTVEEREFVGDLANLTGSPSNATVVAQQDSLVYEISPNNLKRILNEKSSLSELLLQTFITRWQILHDETDFVGLRVIGSRYSRDTLRIRDFLTKNRCLFTWVDLENDPDVDALLEQFGISAADTPVVACGHQGILKNPSNTALAQQLGIKTPLEDTVYDLAIVGAGPAGLAAAVYGASEGLNTVVLEREALGGQASYSSKIENYMGFPTGLSGNELASRAYIQAEKFGAHFSTPTEVVGLECDESYKVLQLADGDRILARCVLIATGAAYHRLNVEGERRFEGQGVYYSATTVEAQLCRKSRVIVVGGGNSAGQAAVFLSGFAKNVLLLIRGDNLSKLMSKYLVQRVEHTNNIEVLTHTEVITMSGDEVLKSATLINNQTQETRDVEVSAVFVFIGAKPCTDWLPAEIELSERGFIKTGAEVANSTYWKLKRQPLFLETSCPGVFAAGDVRVNSINRVASAVGEGAMTVKFAHQVISEHLASKPG